MKFPQPAGWENFYHFYLGLKIKHMRRLISALPALIIDLAGLAGAAAITYGMWQIYPPAGWIAGGALGLAAAWLFARQTDEE